MEKFRRDIGNGEESTKVSRRYKVGGKIYILHLVFVYYEQGIGNMVKGSFAMIYAVVVLQQRQSPPSQPTSQVLKVMLPT